MGHSWVGSDYNCLYCGCTYHCANCGEGSSMYGHYSAKLGKFTCEKWVENTDLEGVQEAS